MALGEREVGDEGKGGRDGDNGDWGLRKGAPADLLKAKVEIVGL
jgi:hypothetical protein